jgi:hypothetical protein
MLTKTFESLRPLRASDDGSAYCSREVLGDVYVVHYGESHWPSKSYWAVPRSLLALDHCSR